MVVSNGPIDDVDRLTILRLAAAAAFGAGDSRRAVALAKAAVREADRRARGSAVVVAVVPSDVPDPAQLVRAETRERLAHYLADTSEDNEHEIAAEAAEIVAAQPESALTARVLATWARTLLWVDPRQSADLLEQAIAVADRTGADHLAADALSSQALLVRRGIMAGDSAELLARALARAGDGTVGAAIRLRALRFLAHDQLEDATPAQALASADQGLAIARDTGLTWTSYGVDLHLLRGWALMAMGRWDDVLDRARRVMYEPVPTASALGIQAVSVLVARRDPEAAALIGRMRAVPERFVQLQLDFDQLRLDLEADTERVAREAAALREQIHGHGMTTEQLHLAAIEAEALTRLAQAAPDEAARGALRERADAVVAAAHELVTVPALSGIYGRLLLARVEAEVSGARGIDEVAAWAAVRAVAVTAGRRPDVALAAAREAAARLERGDRGETTTAAARTALAEAEQIGIPPLVEQVTGMLRRARLSLTGAGPSGGAGEADRAARRRGLLPLT